MNTREFRNHAHQLADWMADYFENISNFPVMSANKPGDTLNKLPAAPPETGENMQKIIADFEHIILPGITHWQSPNYFAYFNANNSFASILGEMLTAALGAQCMSWQTSPAATELEERVMEWLRQMIGLPENFSGVIQDSASSATLCALLTAREKTTGFTINEQGFSHGRFRVYCSEQAHSSVEKAVKIAGLGRKNLRKIPVDRHYALNHNELARFIEQDLDRGLVPLAVVAAIGTTGSTAIDPLDKIAAVCKKHSVWLHVDAAYAGTALLLPEMRWMIRGIEGVDSFVFNPHKWMFTNFDCSAYFVRDSKALINTFSILPEYLKTAADSEVNNYRDWGIPLGRRFRALKLWFVVREFGVTGLQEKIKSHIRWAGELADQVRNSENFELMAPVPLATVCFRFHPPKEVSQEILNSLNTRLMETLNRSGKIYLTHTKLQGNVTLRLVIGQTSQTREHVTGAWKLIRETAAGISCS